MIPKISLNKYITMIEDKEIDPSIKPFDLCYEFYNLSFHNSFKDLRDKLIEQKDKVYYEHINGEHLLFVWDREDEDEISEKLKNLENNWSYFKVVRKGEK